MGYPAKRKFSPKSEGPGKQRTKVPFQRLDSQLNKILLNLADLLLRHGYGYQRVNRLARSAFVRAAQEIGKREHSRPSIARIAALTGMTRIEVSRLVRSGDSLDLGQEEDLNRATRVAYGWANDARYSDGQGKPLRLAFSGRAGFGQLVRKFSGDIPARAMLIEMKRLGMVRHGPDDSVSLVRQRPMLDRSSIEAIRAIAPWVDLIAERNKLSASANLTSATQQVRLYFESQSEALASIRELESRRRSFVSSIEHLGTSTSSSSSLELAISIAVAVALPKVSDRRKQLGAKKRK